jgi:cysteine-rich repeat protein
MTPVDASDMDDAARDGGHADSGSGSDAQDAAMIDAGSDAALEDAPADSGSGSDAQDAAMIDAGPDAATRCGDSVVGMGEGCDDGNTDSGDGCDAACAVEPGWACSGSPSVCIPECGDGRILGPETCDDGNTDDEDGCSMSCRVETGWECTGMPSTCSATCGDGVVAVGGETCDDGNTMAGDGCDASCRTESGYVCYGTRCYWAEVEPNDMVATATPLRGGVGSGTLAEGEDVDVWSFVVPPGPRLDVRIETFDETGMTCESIDTVVDLIDTDGTTVRVTDDDDGVGTCSLIDPDVDPAARSLPPGTYYIRVRPFARRSSPGRYTLVVTLTPAPICGDGTVSRGREECDDMNTSDGDGCSATCSVEPGYECTGEPSRCVLVGPYAVTRIPAACVDTSAGMAVAILGDDVVSDSAALPFTFQYFGAPVTHWVMSSNGNLQLTSGSGSTAYFNRAIPDASPPNAMIAPFWDDLVVTSTPMPASARVLTTGSAPNRVFVAEWANYRPIRAPNGTGLTFQVMLYETTNVIEFHYCSITGTSDDLFGSSATIGIENADGTAGLQMSYNMPMAITAGSGFRFTPR